MSKPNPATPSISACLIVKNEGQHLANCLDSIVGLVSEIVIVDTGSTDDTVAIASQYTEKIFHHTWTDHFADARNVGLAHATGDWILVLDADETVPAETAKLIPDYISRPEFQDRPVVLNFRFHAADHTDLFSRGLFPNGYGIQFAGRVHEVPVLPDQHLPSYHCQQLVVRHDSHGQEQSKQKYYQRLLVQNLAEETDAARINHVQKHLGLNHLALKEWQQAWDVLINCYAGMPKLGIKPTDGFYGEVLRGLVQAGLQIQHPDTRRFTQKLKQYHPTEKIVQEALAKFRPPNPWRTAVVAVTLGVIAACQPSPTTPGTVSKPINQVPIILPAEGSKAAQELNRPIEFNNPKTGDFRIKDANWCPDQTSTINACYQSGGEPIPDFDNPSRDPNGLVCYAYKDCCRKDSNGNTVCDSTPTPTPAPTTNPNPSVTPNPTDKTITLDKEWFSPNGDHIKDSVDIMVTSSLPWMVNIKQGGQVLKQTTGQSSTTFSWDGAEANGKEGKYNVVLVPPRRQSLVWDKKDVGIDLKPPTVDFNAVHKLNGQVELKVTITDPGPNNSGIDDPTVKIETSTSDLTIVSGKDTPIKDKNNKLVYDLVIDQNLFATNPNAPFQVTGLAYSTLAFPGGLINGSYIKVSGYDVAGNPFSRDSDPIAAGGSTHCTNANNDSVLLNSVDPSWFSIGSTTTGGIICTECPSGEASVPDGSGGRVCEPVKNCQPPLFVVSGHTCAPVLGGGGGSNTTLAGKLGLAFSSFDNPLPLSGDCSMNGTGGAPKTYTLEEVFDFERNTDGHTATKDVLLVLVQNNSDDKQSFVPRLDPLDDKVLEKKFLRNDVILVANSRNIVVQTPSLISEVETSDVYGKALVQDHATDLLHRVTKSSGSSAFQHVVANTTLNYGSNLPGKQVILASANINSLGILHGTNVTINVTLRNSLNPNKTNTLKVTLHAAGVNDQISNWSSVTCEH